MIEMRIIIRHNWNKTDNVFILCYINSMKKLIQCNLAKDHVKSTNTIESLNNFAKLDYIESFEKFNKDEPINNNLTSIKATQHNIIQNKSGCLRQKYQAQQVSVLYSEHIYKTSQRDFMMEAQLEKYKAMLQSEKKKKLKLLAEQREWKIQKQKLMEEKKLILFALDSLSVKMEDDQMKNQKELRKQTVEFFKARFNTSQSENKIKHGQSRFKAEKENIENDSMNSSCQKLNFLKKLKKQLSIDESKDDSKQIHQMNDVDEIKIVETQYGQLEVFQVQMQRYEQEINEQRRQLASNKKIIRELQHKLEEQTEKLKNMEQKYAQQKQLNERLSEKIEFLMNKQLAMTKQLQEKQDRIIQLEKQLKLTLESYQEREQKQKQHVQSLQRFTKDLKLNDEKIQQFLKNQFGIDQSNNEVCGSKKAYHQHISYILHLCKKKQTVYDHIIEELKEKMKEDNFRMSIAEKKLKNFSKYHEQLRYYAQNQNKDVVFRSILRFGH